MNKSLIACGAFVAGAVLLPTIAEAQRGGRGGGAVFRSGGFGGGGFGGGAAFRGGGFRGGFAGPAAGFRGGGFRGGAVAVGAGRGFGYGNRPGLVQPRTFYGPGYRPGFAGRPYYGRPYYYGRRYGYGGAVAAGFIGGLALGGLGYGYPYGYGYGYPYGYAGGYGYPVGYNGYDDTCTVVRRRVVTPSGRVVVRDVQVCQDY